MDGFVITDFRIDLGAVNDIMQARFVNRLRTLFAPALGVLPRLASDAQVEQHFALLRHHAASEGFGQRNLSVKYAFAATHLGLFFGHDPLFHDLRKTALWQDPAAHKIVGLNRMFDHADLMIAEGLINRNTGFTPGLIEACELPNTVAPIDVIAQVAPKRAQAFGTKALDRAFAAATDQCAADRPLSDCNPRDAAIACHFLGHGFWRDPLYHWVPNVLVREGLTGLGDRLNA